MVDDEEETHEFFLLVAENLGISCTVAANGEAAAKMLEEDESVAKFYRYNFLINGTDLMPSFELIDSLLIILPFFPYLIAETAKTMQIICVVKNKIPANKNGSITNIRAPPVFYFVASTNQKTNISNQRFLFFYRILSPDINTAAYRPFQPVT